MNHKDLDAWKEAIELISLIYTITKKFPKEEIYGLVSQMRKAAVSIASNIAEGAARKSKNEYLQFLNITQSSLSELETQIIIAKKINYLEDIDNIMIQIEKERKLIFGLIRFLNKNQSDHR
ncbi:MAG: four helix bundle protein [Candidatus Margulisbacteria bacterium]|nr:four helix bundle protein [Candidatus Margulisiibacteriota bacterium]